MRLLCLVLALLLSAGLRAEERVVSFHSDIRIAADGALTVTETIDIQVEGRQVKRGILRDFPTDYRDRYGRKVTVPFTVARVLRDGNAEPYTVSRQANGASVRIGNPGVMLPHGRHVYEITYHTRWQLGFFADHDELYWNVNGNGWTFAMDEISAEVALPQAVPAAQLRVEAYTGPFGARGRDYEAAARDGGAQFRTTRRLGPAEGLTIVFMFPKGVVAEPGLRQRFDRWLGDNLGEAVGLAGILVLAVFLYWRWASVGRDPRAGPVFPRYEAPAGVGPGGVRYVDRMGFDDRCFSAVLLGLGQRGFLKIREAGGVYALERTGTAVEWLPGEAPAAALVPMQGVRAIGGVYDPLVAAARARTAELLTERFATTMFLLNGGTTFLAVLLGAATLGAMHLLGAAAASLAVAAVVIAALIGLALKLMPAYTQEGRRLQDEIEGLRQYLSVAEKDELARQKRPPRTKEEFAKFLPYAVALGVEKTWADAFASVLGAAALQAAAAGYYSSDSPGSPFSGNAGGFADSLGNMGRTISAAATPPGSSSGGSGSGGGGGGGGGGSSGGGGGGGGGSGW